jgi:hypothetical protein
MNCVSNIKLAFCAALLSSVAAGAQQPTHIDAQALTGLTAKEAPSADCALAKDPLRCEAQRAAIEACRNKLGAQHRQCLRELLK